MLLAGYVALFLGAAVVCFACLWPVRRVAEPETRRGLTALLLTSGGWALAHVGYLLAPTASLQHAFYVVGLVVGLAAVGPWLYFCSAYTGRSFHNNRRVQSVAVSLYLLIVSIKITNPVHEWYYVTTMGTLPFEHLLIVHQPLHWVIMGLAYALAVIGFFMLFELFYAADYDVTPLVVLVALTAVPVVLDVGGFASQYILEITYSPLGVAVFAAGVLLVYLDRFQTIQLAGEYTDPVIILDDDDEIRDANERAKHLFPELESSDALGTQLSDTVPAIAEHLGTDDDILEYAIDGSIRYYRVTANPFSTNHAQLGGVITLTDVTEREQYRQELERQNERLEQFASMVSHDLRNPLAVATSYLEVAREDPDGDHLDVVEESLTRMNALIDDVLAFARQGQPVTDTEAVSLEEIATQCWEMVEQYDGTVVVDSDMTLHADPGRLKRVLENLFRNALEHGGSSVTIRVGSLESGAGFYVEDDGRGIPVDEREDVFGSGYTTNQDGTGFGLAIVNEIVEAHDWTIVVTDAQHAEGGARFEIHTTPDVDTRVDAEIRTTTIDDS